MPRLYLFQSNEIQERRTKKLKQVMSLTHSRKNPNRLHQTDLDAQWVKKNDVSYYGYKNNINIDREHGFIRRYDVTPANIHENQMLPALADPKNEQNFFVPV